MKDLQIPFMVFALLGVGPIFEATRAFETFSGNSVVVRQPVHDDLLAAGQNVEIRAPIKGDLAAAGADVSIEETVAGYVMGAGRNVEVNGSVQNDLWVAGASVEINAPIGDNAMLAGREVNLHSSAAVRGDARIKEIYVSPREPRKSARRSMARLKPASSV